MSTRPDPFASLLDGPFNEVPQLPPPLSASPGAGARVVSVAAAAPVVRPAAGATLVPSPGGAPAGAVLAPALGLGLLPAAGPSPAVPQVAQPAKKREIRRLPKDVIKSGDQEQYEEWRRKQDELDRLKALRELEEKQQQLAGAFAPQPALQPTVSGQPQPQPRAKRDKSGGGAAPPLNRIKMEIVERGVPVRKWLLIKWEVEAGQDNDSVCLFEEDVSASHEIWSLPLSSVKPKGSTHCAYPTQPIGRFFAAYLRADGSVVCQSRTLVVGPKVLLKAEIRDAHVVCRYKADASAQNAWDWIGLYVASERCYQNYETWAYVDLQKDSVTLEKPTTPGEYVCAYFCSARRFTPVAFSNFVIVPDVNSLLVAEASVKRGASIHVTFDINCNTRDASDWVGVYRAHDHKKHLYVAHAMCDNRASNQLAITIPPTLEPGQYVARYVSVVAAPLTGGAVVTASGPFVVE